MKIKFNSDGKLPQNKAIEIPSMVIVVGAVFHENNISLSFLRWMNVSINYE